jgi:hypothetical protein
MTMTIADGHTDRASVCAVGSPNHAPMPPCLARTKAVSRPIPEVHPVTKKTRPRMLPAYWSAISSAVLAGGKECLSILHRERQ